MKKPTSGTTDLTTGRPGDRQPDHMGVRVGVLCDNGDADVEKRGHARSERVGGGVPAPPWNAVAGKRAIPANPPLIRRFTPPSHMGEALKKMFTAPNSSSISAVPCAERLFFCTP